MALDILTQDIIIDETVGLQDDDVNSSISPHSTKAKVQHLLSLDSAGGLSSPQVAFQANFVQATASAGESITSVILAQNSSGTPFSTTVGVNSGIRTVDGDYVWLFRDATDADVVIGVIGTSDSSTMPSATGPLAFSFALINTSSTNADLYTVQYVPLLHTIATDPDDRIDLTDHVFAAVSGSTTVSFSGQNAAPGNNEFYVINSPTDASKQILVTGFLGANNAQANVSTQGFGVNNQSIDPTESLQVDFVTGGTLPAGSASQIQYGSHIETITQAGFTINQITPSNPKLRVDITISAFNVDGDEQGLEYWDGSTTNAALITSIKLTGQSGLVNAITANGTYDVAGNVDIVVTGIGTGEVTIRGLDNVTTVDVTTSTPMDRLTIKGVDANEGLDITEFHFSSQTTNAYNEEVGSLIRFDDDGPTIAGNATAVPTLTNDDTEIPDSAGPTSFAGLFTSAFGQDGFKDADDNDVQDADAIAYALDVKTGGSNVASGLTDTLSGDAVVLNKVGGDIVGTVTGTALEVFRIAVSATGAVTFTQSRSVVHNDPLDPAETGASAAGLAADLVTLTATITDGDGDTNSATRNIGDAFKIDDDGPTIAGNATAVPTLTNDDTEIPDSAGPTSFAGLFTSAFGQDGFKDADDNDVQDADAIAYALDVKTGGSNVASGLTDTLSGDAVVLNKVGGDIVGTVTGTALEVFRIAVSATGAVTFTQSRSVVHNDPLDPAETGASAAGLAADLVTLTATITDGDGDTNSATRNIGDAFKIDDDGPTIAGNATAVPTLTNDDTEIPDSAGPTSFAGLFTSAFGQDGFKDADDNDVQDADAIAYALDVKTGGSNVASGLTDTLSGDAVVLNKVGGDIVGTVTGTALEVFRIAVSATGAVTFTQSRSVVHNDPLDPAETGASAAGLAADLVTLTATITDGDGDTNSATRNIGDAFKIDDDGPTIAGNATAVPTLTNDDTEIPDSAGPTSFAGLFTSAFGQDGFKDADDNDVQDADAIAYALDVKTGGSNVASGLTDTLSGDAVVLNKVGGDIVGTVTGTALEVFRIAVSATGAVTFTQSRSVVHNDPLDPAETGASAAGLAADLVTLTATITDGDGDTNSATRNIGDAFKIDDDGPTIAGNATAVPTLTNDDTEIPDSAGPTSFAGLFTSAFGQDGFKDADDNDVQDADAIAYALDVKTGGSNVASGLTDTLSGDAVVLNKVGGDIVGTVTGTALEVFRIAVSATGAVTFTQSRSVVHNDPLDPAETGASAAGLAADLVTLTATITDGDGDTNSATRNIGDAFKIEDDGPTIAGNATAVPTLTNDDTEIPDSAGPTSFAGLFTSAFGQDGFKDADDNDVQDADAIAYALDVKTGGSNVASGLTDTLSGDAVVLNKVGGDIVGTVTGTALEVFRIAVSATGAVTFTQSRSVVHNDPLDPAETGASAAGLAADLVTLTATITDGDGDTNSATRNIGDAFKIEDDGPTIAGNATAVPTLTNDDTEIPDSAGPTSFAGLFTSAFGQDGFKDADDNDVQDADAIAYALGVKTGGSNVASGLTDTLSGDAVVLNKVGGDIVGTVTGTALEVFRIAVSATGAVTFTQSRSVVHNDPLDPAETGASAAGLAADLVTLTATITDGDGDTNSATRNIGDAFKIEDDGPTITAQFDADPDTLDVQTPEQLHNAVGQTASGTFGYDIGADQYSAAFYAGGGSDFVDANSTLAGVQIALTGTVDNAQNPIITAAVATRASESLSTATFNFSFEYDKDPITAGLQNATAGGTLVFDKDNDTYTFTLTDAIDGFSFKVLHTNELVAKQPTGNTGHPLIVAEQLTPESDPDPFFVQFTANSVTRQSGFGFNSSGDGAPVGDTTFNNAGANHDMVTNLNEDWVSATQSTNGVAGDTIQKGELLTLRFFAENILSDVNPGATGGGTERLDPSTTATGVVIKFDGIGSSEDLVLILDLKNAAGQEITRAVNVQNGDLIKGNANIPAPYNIEFTLDNNDALLIIEQNDYTLAGESYQIQGVQIMQSANGLTGAAIDLNGATGANGGSNASASSLTTWDPTDNDVLKIVDIGFVQQTSGTISANLNFAFDIVDGDGDLLGLQNIPVQVDLFM